MVKNVRSDRLPLDSDPKFHKILDDSFNRVFGFRARSNSVMATGDPDQASDYGVLYIIFPKGSFKFIWSEKIYDAYTGGLYGIQDVPEKEQDMMIKANYSNTNLPAAIMSKHEIMINCKDYIAIQSTVPQEMGYGRGQREQENEPFTEWIENEIL